jgi:hypothetical protein
MPEEISTHTIEVTRKTGRSCKRRKEKVEENLNIMRIKTEKQGPETIRNGERLLKAKVHNRLQHSRINQIIQHQDPLSTTSRHTINHSHAHVQY